MAYFLRLIALVCLFHGPSAFAYPATLATPAGGCSVSPCYMYYSALGDRNLTTGGLDAVCLRYATMQSDGRTTYSGAHASGLVCSMNAHDSAYNSDYAVNFPMFTKYEVPPDPAVYACPGGGTLSGSSCGCVAPQVESNGSCGSSLPYDGGKHYFDPACMTVCVNGTCGSGGGCGATVQDGNGNTVPNTPNDCAPGQAFGNVNGLNVCAKPDFTSVGKSTSQSSKDSAGNPVPAASAGGGSSPDANSTERTSCSGGVCSTVRSDITAPPAGSAPGTSPTVVTTTRKEAQTDYCTKNPRAAMCLSSGVGGSCSAGFTCDGDAIQCSIAKSAFDTKCALEAPSEQRTLYENSRNAKNVGANLPGNSTVAIGPGSFSQENALGVGASCLADMSISVMGNPITLPFSFLCQYLVMLGNINVAVAFVLAARIVARG